MLGRKDWHLLPFIILGGLLVGWAAGQAIAALT